MKGIICAGGKATRMYPCTKQINKHILPIANKPMIYYAIEKMVEANISEILIVTGIDHIGDIVGQLGDGSQFSKEGMTVNFTYKVQESANGIAQAISLGENFTGNDDICVILGDNIFTKKLHNCVSAFKGGAAIFIKEVLDPERFGVVEFDGDRIISIEEKPKNPKSNYAVTGIYFYDNTVFDRIKKLKYSDRGELEVTDLNNSYLKDGKLIAYKMDKSVFWSDAGTLDSYAYVNKYMLKIKESNEK